MEFRVLVKRIGDGWLPGKACREEELLQFHSQTIMLFCTVAVGNEQIEERSDVKFA
jgi:hypothetical protein